MVTQLAALTLALVGAVALAIYGIRQGRALRESQGESPFKSFAGEVGRVAEEGAGIHVSLGSGGLLGEQGMVSVAALQGLDSLVELSAAYGTPPIITTGDPTLYLLADNRLRRAYGQLGRARNYPAAAVHFSASDPLPYAAMAATMTSDHPIATSINLGAFDQEVSLLTHTALNRRAKLFGGAVSIEGLAALYPVVPSERMVMGEELFSGGAVATGRPAHWASLKVQNVLRILVIVGIFLAAIASVLGLEV
ncbi:MAG: DUF6754 domain-containing protein [Anaerolineae bacterium]